MANEGIIFGIGGDLDPLHQSLNRAKEAVAGFAQKATGKEGVGALLKPLTEILATVGSVTAVMAGLKGALDMGAEMQDLSNRTGMAVENLYMLRKVFKDSGVEAEKIGPSVAKMQKTLAASTTGGGESSLLRALGLDAKSLASAKPEEAFQKIGEAIGRLNNPTAEAAASMHFFGKTGAELLAVFNSPAFKEGGNITPTAKLLGANAALFKEAHEALDHIEAKPSGFFIGLQSAMLGPAMPLLRQLEEMDFSGMGVSLGNVIGNFGSDFTSELSRVEALAIRLTAIAFSPALIKPLGLELLRYAKQFGEELAKNIPGGVKALEGYRNLVANITTSIVNGANFSRDQGRYQDKANAEKNPAKKKLYQEEADRLKGLIDVPAFSTKATGIDYAAESKEVDASLKKEASAALDELGKQIEDAVKKSGVFVPTEATTDANEKERLTAKAKSSKKTGAFDPSLLGQDVTSSIISDSLAKIGGGGNSIGARNPILEEAQRQTAIQTKMLAQLEKQGAGSSPKAAALTN